MKQKQKSQDQSAENIGGGRDGDKNAVNICITGCWIN